MDEAHVDGAHDDVFIVATELSPCFFDQRHPNDSIFSFGFSASKSGMFFTLRICDYWNEVIDDDFLPGSVDAEIENIAS